MKRYSFYIVILMLLQSQYLAAWQVRHTLENLVRTSPLIGGGTVIEVSAKIEKVDGKNTAFTYVTVDTNFGSITFCVGNQIQDHPQ